MVQIKEMHQEDLQKISDFSDFDDFWTISILEKDIQETSAIYYQAIQEEEIVGILGAKQILDVVEIMNIAVKKERRNQGIGRMLFAYFLQQMQKDETIQKIELEVNENNAVAIHLYETHGFKRVGKRPGYYGNQADAILMNFEKENSRN